MEMKSMHRFTSECDKAHVYVESDMPIGVFHDFLMLIKGAMVDRMTKAHKEQLKEIEASKQNPIHESELPNKSEEINCTNKCSPKE